MNHGGQTREVDRAIELLARDHAQDPKIMQIGGTPANSTSPAGERLLAPSPRRAPIAPYNARPPSPSPGC